MRVRTQLTRVSAASALVALALFAESLNAQPLNAQPLKLTGRALDKNRAHHSAFLPP